MVRTYTATSGSAHGKAWNKYLLVHDMQPTSRLAGLLHLGQRRLVQGLCFRHQALLQHREQELQQLQERDAVAQETVKKLTSQVRELKSRATRSENEVALHKREIGFLEALVVSVFVLYTLKS